MIANRLPLLRVPAWALVVALSACSTGLERSPTASAPHFSIDSPRNGETVGSRTVEVLGTGPAGAEIVRDISMRPDKRTTAGPDGVWRMEISLDEGRNEFSFRIGDDESTAQELVVVYDPELARVSQSPSPRATRVPAASRAAATPRSTPSSNATPADATAFVREVCAGTTYERCIDSILSVWEQLPGSLVAICEYGDGQGDVVLIESEADAEEECSGGGLIFPSEVFAVVELPD